jgi:hypothetical protein
MFTRAMKNPGVPVTIRLLGKEERFNLTESP